MKDRQFVTPVLVRDGEATPPGWEQTYAPLVEEVLAQA